MVSWSSIVRPAAQFAKYRAVLQTPAVKNGKFRLGIAKKLLADKRRHYATLLRNWEKLYAFSLFF